MAQRYTDGCAKVKQRIYLFLTDKHLTNKNLPINDLQARTKLDIDTTILPVAHKSELYTNFWQYFKVTLITIYLSSHKALHNDSIPKD